MHLILILVFLRKRSDGSPELILLDHGLYEILPQAMRLSLCQFWEAIVLKDRTKMDRFAKDLNVNGNYGNSQSPQIIYSYP